MSMKIQWETGLGLPGCCALLHAFIHNPAEIKKQAELYGMEKVRMCADVLKNSLFLSVPVSVMGIYGALANAEIERLAGNPEAPEHCKNQLCSSNARVHTNEDHRNALRLLLAMSRPRYTANA